MKKTAVGNLGAEESAQVLHTVVNRASNRAEADVMFGSKAAEERKKAGEKLRQLFLQAPAAQTGTTPSHDAQKTASVAPNVEAFFDKLAEARLTDAQRRYPELQKVAVGSPVKVPGLALKKPPGAIPARSSLSGGSA